MKVPFILLSLLRFGETLFCVLASEIRFDNFGVILDRLWIPLCDDLSEVQNNNVFAYTHDEIHIMLYKKHRDIERVADFSDIVHELFCLGRVHSCGGLVKKEYLGACCKRTHDLEPSLGTLRER